tara:strand:+ start:343 stop:546 length:204 start_codon:yes stop_codon:yes gene_type:complete
MEPHMLVEEEAVFQSLELLVVLMVLVDLVVEELAHHQVEEMELLIQAVVVVDQTDLIMVDLVEKVLL